MTQGNRKSPNLDVQVNRLPTLHGFSKDGRSNGPSGNELGCAVNRSMRVPTPTVACASGGDRKDEPLLTEVARRMTTSCASDTGHRTGQYAQGGTALSTQAGGSLNPEWVEWLHGWPLGWTCAEELSHISYFEWLNRSIHEENNRIGEAVRAVREANLAEEISGCLGKHVQLHEAAVLLAIVCEHQNRPDEAWLFMACAKALEDEVRSVRPSSSPASPPHQSGCVRQLLREHPDLVQALPQLLAHYGKTDRSRDCGQNAVPRVATRVADRVDRISAIGDGQVPAVVALAWRLVNEIA